MAFIGTKISADVARLFRNVELPGDRVAENEEHITILCFEDNYPIKSICKTMEAALEVMEETEPFQVKVSKITCFPKVEGKPVPIIAKVDSKPLQNLNEKLKKAFDKKKVKYLNNFKEYKPHITLSYAEDEIDNILIKPIEFTITEVVFWCGEHGDDRLFITYPLKGVQIKNSFLSQKSDLYCKLAGNY